RRGRRDHRHRLRPRGRTDRQGGRRYRSRGLRRADQARAVFVLCQREVREAFDNLDDLDYDLAAAGEARQEIDLVRGAALTRFLSLTAKQRGNDFISVGRVQSPTLKLIVDRERKIQAFDPETYWELFSDLHKDDTVFEVQYFDREAGRGTDRLWDESVA